MEESRNRRAPGITEQVVKNYLRIIYAKIGVRHRTELALWYEEQVHTGFLGKITN